VDPFLPTEVQRLVRLLSRLPSIGERSALRLALYLLRQPDTFREQLGEVLQVVGQSVAFCPRCRNLSPREEPCVICTSEVRDDQVICVVEGIPDLIAVEHSGQFRGRYHVLHGVLSPMRGVGPEELGLPLLHDRVASTGAQEVILSTNMNVEGEATASYVAALLSDLPARVTRIAAGIPMGGTLEFLDGMTIGNAFRERREIEVEID
jgi:recombination protein RecR